MIRVELPTSTASAPFIVLRTLTGRDEIALPEGEGLGAVVDLVKGLRRDGAAEIEDISVADFDLVAAGMFTSLYGDRLDCRGQCRACGEGFEFTLSCKALLPQDKVVPGGVYETDGVRFRLPTLRDLAGSRGDDLWRGCCLDGCFASAEAADAAFESIAPLGVDDIDTVCPKCSEAQRLRFDIVDYLAGMLRRERPFLLHEIHCLARAYGWSLGEILSLERDNRRDLVRLVTHEATRAPERARLVMS